jgi:hypothetical protein
MSPPAAVSATLIFWWEEVRWVDILVRRGWKFSGGKDIILEDLETGIWVGKVVMDGGGEVGLNQWRLVPGSGEYLWWGGARGVVPI